MAIPNTLKVDAPGVADLLVASAYIVADRGGYRQLQENVERVLEPVIEAVQEHRVPHERDLFTEFAYRDGGSFQSSWHALAAAQHYQAGTRLLDWSDSLLVGLAFAVAGFSRELASKDVLRNTELAPVAAERLNELPEPAIWVLSPYHLAAESGETSILDPTWDQATDYYQMFLTERVRWQTSKPLPLTISWETPRIAAQRGTFTIHGRCPSCLREQVSKTVLGKVVLSRHAALYAVYLIRDVCAFDGYSLNRDRHNLGKSIRLRHLGY
ncbi:MAG: FRG domain-containing protein [bacterium]|nr:FRG domain-containing protein [bacterium]